jgi:signal peptidase II
MGMVWTIVIILLTGADQLLKLLVTNRLREQESIAVINGFFYIVHRRNTGAAWSFLANKDWGIYVLAGISAIVSIVMIILLIRTANIRLKACLAIITAGSIGNLIDRVRLGSVTDYLDFHIGSYVFPTFNLADMCIVIGTILLCLLILAEPKLLEPGQKPRRF